MPHNLIVGHEAEKYIQLQKAADGLIEEVKGDPNFLEFYLKLEILKKIAKISEDKSAAENTP